MKKDSWGPAASILAPKNTSPWERNPEMSLPKLKCLERNTSVKHGDGEISSSKRLGDTLARVRVLIAEVTGRGLHMGKQI